MYKKVTACSRRNPWAVFCFLGDVLKKRSHKPFFLTTRCVTMKKVVLLLGLLTILGLTQAQAQSSTELGVRVGVDVEDVEEPYIGAGLRFRTASLPVTFAPSFDYFFAGDDVNLYRLGLNVIYEFRNTGQLTPYVGGGANIGIFSFDDENGDDESDTDTGLNVLGGVKVHLRNVTPFFQLDAGLSDPEFVTLGGGLLFRL